MHLKLYNLKCVYVSIVKFFCAKSKSTKFRAKKETKKMDESVSSESTPAATESQELPQSVQSAAESALMYVNLEFPFDFWSFDDVSCDKQNAFLPTELRVMNIIA